MKQRLLFIQKNKRLRFRIITVQDIRSTNVLFVILVHFVVVADDLNCTIKENASEPFIIEGAMLRMMNDRRIKCLFWLHIGVHRLNIVKLFQLLNHLVKSFTFFWCHILQVVRDVSKLSTSHLKPFFL